LGILNNVSSVILQSSTIPQKNRTKTPSHTREISPVLEIRQFLLHFQKIFYAFLIEMETE